MDITEVDSFRDKHNNTGIYTTAYRYKTRNQKGEIWADYFYADFDTNDLVDSDNIKAIAAWERIKEDVRHVVTCFEVFYGLNKNYLQFYFSGKKGVSLLVPSKCLGIKPHKHLNEIFKDMVTELAKYTPNQTLDTKIYDRIRVWRLENSIHEKSGLYKIPLTYQELMDKPIDKIKDLAKRPRNIQHGQAMPTSKAIKKYKSVVDSLNLNPKIDKPKKIIKFVPPCIQHLLDTEVSQGRRNNTLAALANFCRQAGKSESETKQLLRQWNKDSCIPSIPSREFTSTLRSAYRSKKTWGCRTFSEISKCNPKICKLHKRRSV